MSQERLSPAQRSHLKSLGHHLQPIVTVGKEGITDGVVAALEQALLDHELVKVRVGKSSTDDRHDVAAPLAERTKAHSVSLIGKTLLLYKRHPHIHAIVHAHPPMASTFVAARKPINVRLIAEAYAIVGEPEYAPYALMGTDELADSVAGSFKKHTCCVLMENHGVLCTGDTLLQAFDRIEVLENIAKINLNIAQLGGGVELDDQQLREIATMMGRDG